MTVTTSEVFPRSTRKRCNDDVQKTQEDVPFKQSAGALEIQELSPGTLVVGCVTSIVAQGLYLDLPYMKLAFVPLKHMTEPEHAMDSSDILSAFSPGEPLQAVVISAEFRLIQCSLRPSLINAGLTFASLKASMWLPATLLRPEDFGWLGTLGLSDSCSGWEVYVLEPKCPRLKRSWDLRCHYKCSISVGIKSVNPESRSVTCAFHDDAEKPFCLGFQDALSLAQLRAGFFHHGLVTGHIRAQSKTKSTHQGSTPSPSSSGIEVQFARLFTATIPISHIPLTKQSLLVPAVGAKVCFRSVQILHKPDETKIVGSLHPHHLRWITQGEIFCPIGLRFTDCRILACSPRLGARILATNTSVPENTESLSDSALYFHMNQAQHVVIEVPSRHLPKETVKDLSLTRLSVPEVVMTRVNYFQRSLQGVALTALLEKPFLRLQQLYPTQIVEGVVHKVVEESKLVVVTLSPFARGILPFHHIAQRENLPSAYTTHGAKVKCRVLYVKQVQGSGDTFDLETCVFLTARKQFLRDTGQLVTSYDERLQGQRCFGIVSSKANHDSDAQIKVHFFNRVHGWIPRKEFQDYAQPDHLKPGNIVSVKITNVHTLARQMHLTLNLYSPDVPAAPRCFPQTTELIQILTDLQAPSQHYIRIQAFVSRLETRCIQPFVRLLRENLDSGLIQEGYMQFIPAGPRSNAMCSSCILIESHRGLSSVFCVNLAATFDSANRPLATKVCEVFVGFVRPRQLHLNSKAASVVNHIFNSPVPIPLSGYVVNARARVRIDDFHCRVPLLKLFRAGSSEFLAALPGRAGTTGMAGVPRGGASLVLSKRPKPPDLFVQEFEALSQHHPLPRFKTELEVGRVYPGIVQKVTKAGVFVRLSPGLFVRILLRELPEAPIDVTLAQGLYPHGKTLPFVRIVSTQTTDSNRYIEASLVSSSFSTSSAKISDGPKLAESLTFDQLQIGDCVRGHIFKVQPTQVLVSIDSTLLKVRCPVDESQLRGPKRRPVFSPMDEVIVEITRKSIPKQHLFGTVSRNPLVIAPSMIRNMNDISVAA